MLTINAKQMEIFEAAVRGDFFRRQCDFLRSNAGPDVAHLDDVQLQNFVKDSHDSAVAHGATSERSFMMWLCLEVMAGARFFEIPEVADLLKRDESVDLILINVYDRLAVLEIRRKG